MKALATLAALLFAIPLAAESPKPPQGQLLKSGWTRLPAPVDYGSLKTTGGEEYRAVRIFMYSPAEVSAQHLKGRTVIPLAALPPAVQTYFGYDAARAALWKQETGRTPADEARRKAENEAVKAEAALKAERRAKVDAAAIDMSGEVFDVTRQGVWLKNAKAVTETGEGTTIYVAMEQHNLKKGDRVRAKMWPIGTRKEDVIGRKPLEGLSFTTNAQAYGDTLP